MKKEFYHKIGSPEALSLKEILVGKKFRLITEKKRSYSLLDPILLKNKDKYMQEVLTFKQLFGMLKLDRVDIMIEYSPVLDKEIKRSDEFVFVPIQEMYEYAYSYALCPKNKWGKQAIADINIALKKIVYTENFQKHVKSLYNQEQDRIKIDDIYKKNFLNEYK
jgi:uncharacterized protein (TIGR02285 family)